MTSAGLRGARAYALCVAAALAAGLWAALPATAASPLTLQRADTPGLKAGRAKVASGRRALARAISPALLPALEVKQAGAARFVRRRAELWSVSFVLKTPIAARTVLLAARRSVRAHHLRSSRVGVGDGGFVVQRRDPKRPIVVLWRRGAAFGAVVFSARLDRAMLRVASLGYARVADGRLAAVVSLPAWQRTLARIGPRGQVSRKTALDLFALAYGPLPGTRRPRGPYGSIPDGTPALRHVLQLWPTLSPAQRAAAGRLLGITDVSLSTRRRPRGSLGVVPSRSVSPASFGDPNFVPNALLQSQAETFAKAFAAKLNYTLKLQIVAGGTTSFVAEAAADAAPVDVNGKTTNDAKFCRIRLTTTGQKTSLQYRNFTIAHEVFHCYEYDIAGPKKGLADPDWIIEGMADWAAFEAYPVPFNSSAAATFHQYLSMCTEQPLFARSYDAVGFWGHFDDSLGSPWDRVITTLSQPSDVERFEEARGNEPLFLDTWASSVVVKAELGSAWYAQHPVKPFPDYGCSEVQAFGDGGTLTAPKYTLWPYQLIGSGLGAERPLLHIGVKGHGRLADGKVDTADLGDAWFCLLDTCECPPGTEGTPPPAPHLDLPAHLALTGGEQGAQASIRYESLDTYCKQKQKPPPPPGGVGGGGGGGGGGGCGRSASSLGASGGCLPPPVECQGVGCGYSSADPHLEPFGGVWYDFQAVGEFTLVRSTADDLEVQVRQQPYPGSHVVSVNTAVALRVAGDRVAVYKGRPLSVRLNGRPVLLGRKALRLPYGGAASALRGSQVEVDWPDGTVVRVIGIGDYEIDLIVSLAPARVGKVRGLLGNSDRKLGGDFVTRSGRRLADRAVRRTGRRAYNLLYRVFGDSWRVSRRGSLFDYAPGQSTRTFTNRRFPARLTSTGGLTAAARRKAERACRRLRIKAARVLENCILDVGSTGHFGFATAGATLERSARKQRGGGKAHPPADGRWTRISAAAATNSLLVVPSLAAAGDKVVAAYVATDRTVEAATFTPSVLRDAAGLRRDPIATGPERLGNPQLLSRPGGGLQALVDGVPLQSISFAPRNADGSFGSPVIAAGDIHATAAGPAVPAPDGQPIWPANYGGALVLWKGSAGALSSDLTSVAAPPASSIYIPKLARDSEGRYWLAWYVISTRTPKQSGVYLSQIDPGSLRFLGAPQRAPGSETNVNNGLELALACARACRVAYVQQVSAARARIVSWAPGSAPRPISGAGRPGQPTYRVAAAYTPSGRLWVAWWDDAKSRFVATLGNPAGAGARVLAIGSPAAPSSGAGALSAIAAGADLVLVANWSAPDGRSAARYVNVVRAPG